MADTQPGHGEKIGEMRALAHPVRLRMLSLLTGTAMSAAEVARELELTHANASYHLRVLADAGELVVDGEEKVRGGVAKRYRYPHEHEGRHVAPPSEHNPAGDALHLRATFTELERRVATRVPGGWLSDLDGWVDPAVWAEALEHLRTASRLLHDGNRPPRSEGTVHVSFTALAFGMQPAPTSEHTEEQS
jgi:DNA-binding transcriptional ArsR family regulator